MIETNEGSTVQRLYHRRFRDSASYRNRVWQVLTSSFFQQWVQTDATILDLGCGYGEFINNIKAARRYAMDFNPDAKGHLASDVGFFQQDCAKEWPFEANLLDVVFTSNFFEHLRTKEVLQDTLREIYRCLRVGGRLIAVGPNIKHLPGSYWDFFDHHLPLTELSLGEALEIEGFRIEDVKGRFLPYTLVNTVEYPLAFVKLYLKMPVFWRMLGKQFLLIARK